ncbi:oxidoreductase, 2OG-Fe(II) oxygenase family [Aspergillus alliaceus]|uniref:oxidoreductase, 2OG-Fe(II) oxygenase family n=1 Tax=Petromyces alliaceus TaxID=209559 RepID=UPI0012A5E835|nr:uncharacterized protein BDW43DRAFT_102605 [Aspergillus alliaceus]KAB8232747.1 hypothetical protein BDW43DRAFT_102605 [Aspergillus alliaceus]
MLKLSTVLSSLFYLLPIYIFLIAPALRQLFPPSNQDLAFDLDDDDAAAADLEGPILNGSILSLDDGVEVTCPPDTYRVHLLRRDPLVIYIEDFLSDSEADHLVKLSQNSYTPSMIYDGTAEKIDPTTRLSDRALLPRDTTVRCLENRAKAFQGWRPHLYIERMWAQRYNASGHYRHHYDWAGSSARGGDRASTFMVYLGDECKGGGTHFPRFKRPADESWCQFVECGEGAEEGTTFRPIKGNAIFWENLRPDGTGYLETWHAAFPVTEGVKVGLNIWSWYQPPRWRR